MDRPLAKFMATLSVGTLTLTGLAGCVTTSEKAGQTAAPTKAPVATSRSGGYLAGQHAFSVRDLSSASNYFNGVLSEDPNNLSVTRRTFLLELEQGHIDRALTIGRNLEALDQKAPFQGLTLALADVKSGRYEDALKRLDQLPKSPANAVLMPMLAAWAEVGAGRPDQAMTSLDPLKKVNGFDSLRIMHTALILELKGEVGQAEKMLRDSYDKNQRKPARLFLNVAEFYARNGKLETALDLASGRDDSALDGGLVVQHLKTVASAGKISTDRAVRFGMSEALFDIASAVQRERGSDSAMVYSQLAIYLRPDFSLAKLLAGEIFDDRKQYERALEMYGAVSEQSVYSPMARLRTASSLRSAGRKDDAVAQLMAIAGKDTTDPEPWVRLGDLHRSNEEWLDAIGAYDEAVARTPEPKRADWSLFYTRGIAKERAKRWDQAEKDFLKALDLRPEQPYVMNYLGYSWVDQGINLDRAEVLISKAVKLRPNDGYIVDSLGWLLYRTGRFEEAVERMEKAVELRPTDPTINDHLGDGYWQVGRRAEARFQWRRALSFGPDPDMVAIIEDKIRFGLMPDTSINVTSVK